MDKFLNIVVHKLQGAHKAPEIVGKMCECTFVFLRRSFIMFLKVMTYMGKESKKEWIYVCIYIYLKLTQHCTSTTLQ